MRTNIIATFWTAILRKRKVEKQTNKPSLRLRVGLVWATAELSRKCCNTTSVKAVRAVEIRTARHLESINDNKRVKVKRGFFLEIC